MKQVAKQTLQTICLYGCEDTFMEEVGELRSWEICGRFWENLRGRLQACFCSYAALHGGPEQCAPAGNGDFDWLLMCGALNSRNLA
jgi:hypothetical protein